MREFQFTHLEYIVINEKDSKNDNKYENDRYLYFISEGIVDIIIENV